MLIYLTARMDAGYGQGAHILKSVKTPCLPFLLCGISFSLVQLPVDSRIFLLTAGHFHSLTMYSLAMEDRSDIPPGTLYMLVLKTLARLGEMHGYGIAQHIQQISEEVLQVEEGSLYPALQRMLIKGWVVAEWKQSESNRRARFYRLTADGRKQLAREVKEFERVMAAIVRVIRPA
jgi:PadR family transcriptional regulator PadR